MKLIFLGTPDFAATVLESILKSKHEVVCVVTQPDRPANRNQVVASQVKQVAIKHGIEVLQFEKLRTQGVTRLAEIDADIMVTCAYGQILSEEILQLKKYGVLNVHASLLPKYRGSSPIQWAVINGEEKSGITIMQTVYAIDAGDILLQKSIALSKTETGGSLFNKLAPLGGEAIVEALDLIEKGEAVFYAQDTSQVSHVPMLKKSDGLIDFSKAASQLDCFVRGMTPWPSAFSYLEGTQFKVFQVEKSDIESGDVPFGTVLKSDDQLIVKCGDGAVRLLQLQPQNGKRMSDTQYLLGHKINVGARFSG